MADLGLKTNKNEVLQKRPIEKRYTEKVKSKVV